MKALIYLGSVLLTFATMSNSSCRKDSIESLRTISFNRDFELSLNDSVIVQGEEKELGITLARLDDSRCPEGVQCVWAGNASVTIQLTGTDGMSGRAELCIGDCPVHSNASETASIKLGSHNYLVKLKDVKPYPKTGEQKSQKIAVLTISKYY